MLPCVDLLDVEIEWRPVPGWDGIEITRDRQVRQIHDRVFEYEVATGSLPAKRVRKTIRAGVLTVFIWRSGKGRYKKEYHAVSANGKTVKVAVLMLLAWVGPKPFPKAVSRHLNDDSLDDRIENLAWGTQLENMEDAERNRSWPYRK